MSSKNRLYQVSCDDKGKFLKGSSGNPSGRLTGTSCRALKTACDAVESIALPMVITACENGSLEACKILLCYGLPRQRPVSITKTVTVSESHDLSRQMKQLLHSIYYGEISSTVASEIAGVISMAANFKKLTVLRRTSGISKTRFVTRKNGQKK